MDGRRFDEATRAWAGAPRGSRRGVLRGMLGGLLAGGFALGRGSRAGAQEATVELGGICASTDDCRQPDGGLVICGDNGIADDGALNCCRNAGGACDGGRGCCGALACVEGVCGGGTAAPLPPPPAIGDNTGAGFPVGSACTATSQCLPSTSGTVICASNTIEADGELNCCLQAGGQCGGFDEYCCGNLLCLDGVCSAPRFGDAAPGGVCAANLDCSQDGGPAVCGDAGLCCRLEVSTCGADADCCDSLVCGDNQLSGDGALTCCSTAGGPCGSDAACCGSNYCIDGTCQALA